MQRIVSKVSFMVVLAFVPSCLPIPTLVRDPIVPEVRYRINPRSVLREYVLLEGYPESHTPPQYNQSPFVRYYADAEPPETILVLVPGLLSGALTFDDYARKLVASTPRLEVWAQDRRANLLEDRRGFEAAFAAADPQLAYDYYIARRGQEGGFQRQTPRNFDFVGYWGIDVHLHDLHAIVRRARAQASTVVLGGHSLGGSIVGLYSAFDVDDDPAQVTPGYRFIDGLFLLDGALGRTGGFGDAQGNVTLGIIELIPTVEALEDGTGMPFRPEFERLAVRSEVSMMLAQFDPEGLSPFMDFPITNRAYVGVQNDDNYVYSTIFSNSMGETVGARKSGNIVPVLLGGRAGFYSSTVSGVAEDSQQVSWSRGDSSKELTDIDAFIRSYVSPFSSGREWYFPLRLALDIVQLDITLEGEAGFIPTAEVPVITLAVGAKRGLMPSLAEFSAYSNVRFGAPLVTYIVPGTHTDMLYADESLLVPLTLRWLDRIEEITGLIRDRASINF
jgi:hypothetical protein